MEQEKEGCGGKGILMDCLVLHMLYMHTKTGRSKGGKTEREMEGGRGKGGGGGGEERERKRERWERAIYMSTIITYSIGVGGEWKGEGYALQWNLRIKDTLGAEVLSSFRRLSSGGRFEPIGHL